MRKSCSFPCSPSDWRKGGKCDTNGCYDDPVVEAALKDYPQLKGKSREERQRFLINAIAEAAEKQDRGDFPFPQFYRLDEGDGKPRCAVQCPYCEKV